MGIAHGEHNVLISKKGYKQWERTLRSSTGNIKVAAVLESIPAFSTKIADATSEIRREATQPTESQSSASARGPEAPNDESRSGSAPANSMASPTEEALIGVRFTGNPTVRHDGVEISVVQPSGPAANIDMKPGDVVLAINDHYLFTINEVRAELQRHEPGTRLKIRYRRNRLISENYLTLGAKVADSGR